MVINPELRLTHCHKILVSNMSMTEREIAFLKVGQSENPLWIKQQKGRLTASKFKSTYTRANALKQFPESDTSNILPSILGYKLLKTTWQMMHGISKEVHAKTKYLSVMRKERHVRLSSIDPGMTVMREHPFISAYPDLDVSCDCCGDGLAEFKCPASSKDQIPTAGNLSYLEIRDGKQTVTATCISKSKVKWALLGRNTLISSYLHLKAGIMREFILIQSFGMMSLRHWFGSGISMLVQS